MIAQLNPWRTEDESNRRPEKRARRNKTHAAGFTGIGIIYYKVIDAVKSGAIKCFVFMTGCDGRQKSRSYFTEVAQNLPKDKVIRRRPESRFDIFLDFGSSLCCTRNDGPFTAQPVTMG
jgi:hypothetical protein